MKLEDKHVLITGGSRGIGAELARQLRAEGARLTLVARPSAVLEATAAEVSGRALPADLSDAAALEGLIARAEAQSGPVDVLVNNAALGVTRHFATLSAGDVSRALVTNLLTPMELSRQVLAGMLARKSGAILNVSSITGEFAMPSTVTYASTKAGLTMFSLNLQRDIRDSKVCVSVFILGAVPDTDIYQEGVRDPAVRRLADQLAVLSTLKPLEIAQRMVKSLKDDHRGVVVMPKSAAPAIAMRMAPIRMGDLVFSRGTPPHNPELEALIAQQGVAGER